MRFMPWLVQRIVFIKINHQGVLGISFRLFVIGVKRFELFLVSRWHAATSFSANHTLTKSCVLFSTSWKSTLLYLFL